MYRYILAALMMLFTVEANALGISSECAPEVSAKITHGDSKEDRYNGWSQDEETTISFGIKWKLGLGKVCDQMNQHRIETQRQRARQEEIEAISDKIKVCKSFDPQTAPASIIHFCGDLLTRR